MTSAFLSHGRRRAPEMAEYVALRGGGGEEADPVEVKAKGRRIASLDVFRGLSIALMIFVDYAGPVFPVVAHSPWHGVRLADFVTPFFLFIAGISLSLVYKKTSNKLQATQQATLRALKLFLLGVLLQGGYFHGVNSLSFGIDIEKIRWSGILQLPLLHCILLNERHYPTRLTNWKHVSKTMTLEAFLAGTVLNMLFFPGFFSLRVELSCPLLALPLLEACSSRDLPLLVVGCLIGFQRSPIVGGCSLCFYCFSTFSAKVCMFLSV
ncbi:heparan-alpha-glucosaminide N-acetyltransferase-like [Phalaenopsis equestris]|uniref:heparan-alpha-glucosaminide N-acetyltransferase-like n=1 Tax=Phalaenopsis equestris TaxID=78828 RepID=UPI0009E2AE3B|nr:heparan-alpha-glucosaminide N-acetyltransferase-like [Phalaenopsis equestris]